MEFNARIFLCLCILSSSALAASFSVMRISHPGTRPGYDVAFACAFTVLLACMFALATAYLPVAARASEAEKTQVFVGCMACVAGLWLSVGVATISARYDISVLQLQPIKLRQGRWPWVTFPACFVHVVSGLALGCLAVSCWTFTG